MLAETLFFFLAPHTSGPRDVPRCGALSLLQKTPHYRGDPAETAARLHVKLWVLTARWWCLLSYCFFYTEIKSRDSEIKSRRQTRSGPFAGHSRLLVCASVSHHAARCPARVARCPRPRHDRTCLIYCSRQPPSRAPHRYSVPQPQAAAQPFKPSAPPRRHCQRPQLVKGKSPQESRVTVQIEQYLLDSAAKLKSCSSPTATASRLT